jgi:uncharacterized protein YjbI with pentapeptide repeats
MQMEISSKNNLLRRYISSILIEMSTRYKRETGENLPRWQERLKEYEDAGGFFVHFSYYDKLGLNPQNTYNTPTGFYAYPLRTSDMANFGIDRPYAVVFKINDSSGILDLESYTDGNLFDDFDKLRDLYRGTSVADKVDDIESQYNDGEWFSPNAGKAIWEAINEIVDNYSPLERSKKLNPASNDASSPVRNDTINMRRAVLDFVASYPSVEKALEGAKNEDFAGSDWNAEVFCSRILGRPRRRAMPVHLIDKKLSLEQQKILARNETDSEFYGECKIKLLQLIKLIPAKDLEKVNIDANKLEYTDNKLSLEKTRIFRDLGYTGVVDNGQGIIHPNEPSQAVFFETGALRHIETIEKKVDSSLEAEDLTKVPQSGRDFSNQDWTGKEIKQGKYISSILNGVEAEKSYIVASKFLRATCIRGNFVESYWTRSDLSDANFEGSLFSKGELNSTKAVKTNFGRAVFVNTRISLSNFFQSNFEGADFLDSVSRVTSFNDCSFKSATLETSRFFNCSFVASDFTGADFSGAQFADCNFQNANLEGALGLENATFESCKLPRGYVVSHGQIVKSKEV